MSKTVGKFRKDRFYEEDYEYDYVAVKKTKPIKKQKATPIRDEYYGEYDDYSKESRKKMRRF